MLKTDAGKRRPETARAPTLPHGAASPPGRGAVRTSEPRTRGPAPPPLPSPPAGSPCALTWVSAAVRWAGAHLSERRRASAAWVSAQPGWAQTPHREPCGLAGCGSPQHSASSRHLLQVLASCGAGKALQQHLQPPCPLLCGVASSYTPDHQRQLPSASRTPSLRQRFQAVCEGRPWDDSTPAEQQGALSDNAIVATSPRRAGREAATAGRDQVAAWGPRTGWSLRSPQMGELEKDKERLRARSRQWEQV